MELDPAGLDTTAVYRLVTSLIVPRPIAWMGTLGSDGRDNLAPFSYFMGVSSAPPMVAVSVARGPRGVLKDSARNLLDTGECTISMVERPQLEAMNLTAGAWEASEFDVAGLERVGGVKVRAPRPAVARVSVEGRLAHTLDLGQTHLFVIELVWFHVDDALWAGGVVAREGYAPMARLGGDGYAGIGTILDLPRVKGR